MAEKKVAAAISPAAPGDSQAPVKKKGTLDRIGSAAGRLTRPRQKFQMPNSEQGLRIVIATDAWKPQLNGVVRTLDTLGIILSSFGNEVRYITPNEFKSVPLPSLSLIHI